MESSTGIRYTLCWCFYRPPNDSRNLSELPVRPENEISEKACPQLLASNLFREQMYNRNFCSVHKFSPIASVLMHNGAEMWCHSISSENTKYVLRFHPSALTRTESLQSRTELSQRHHISPQLMQLYVCISLFFPLYFLFFLSLFRFCAPSRAELLQSASYCEILISLCRVSRHRRCCCRYSLVFFPFRGCFFFYSNLFSS